MSSKQRYERIPFDDTALPIRINYSMSIHADAIFKEENFSWHEQIELLYFRQGEASVYCGNRPIAVKEGDVVLINPYEIHQVVHTRGAPLYDCIMIDASLYRNVAQHSNEIRFLDILANNHVCFENLIIGDSEFLHYIEKLCEEVKVKDFAYELAVKSHVLGLLVCLFRRHIRNDSSFQQLVENVERYDRIKPAISLMKGKLAEHITLEELAGACHLSSSHFCRLFRQITGYSPIQYLLDIRLQEAATLLKRTDDSITQIAYAVGFDDVGYFSRKFREQFGMSPTQAKKRYSHS